MWCASLRGEPDPDQRLAHARPVPKRVVHGLDRGVPRVLDPVPKLSHERHQGTELSAEELFEVLLGVGHRHNPSRHSAEYLVKPWNIGIRRRVQLDANALKLEGG